MGYTEDELIKAGYKWLPDFIAEDPLLHVDAIISVVGAKALHFKRINQRLNDAGVPKGSSIEKRIAFLIGAFENLHDMSYDCKASADDPSWEVIVDEVHAGWEEVEFQEP